MPDRTDILTRPLYGHAESDYLAGVTRGTSRRWLKGYHYKGVDEERIDQPPVTLRDDPAAPGVSFTDLVEVAAIGRLKSRGFNLRDIRGIVTAAQEILGVPRPLTSETFKISGRDAFVAAEGHLINVSTTRRQTAWESVLAPFLETLEYEQLLARRWWPLGDDKAILIDPSYAFGLPVVAGSSVRTEIIFERFSVDETREEIADDFRLTAEQVDNALRFEVNRAKLAA